MVDGKIRKAIDPILNRIGAGLAFLGLSATLITITGFLFGVLAWIALAFGHYPLALGLILCNRIADGLDGAVARQRGASNLPSGSNPQESSNQGVTDLPSPTDRNGVTDLGGYLDIVLDFFFYAGVPFFFAVGRPESALSAAFLVFSFVGTGSSFLAFAAIAAKRGMTTETSGRKSLYYLGGLTEGTETILLFLLICVFPGWFDLLAWTFGGLCWITTACRVAWAYEAFGGKSGG